jgi:hypothetical protein
MGKQTTTLQVRGVPTAGQIKWHSNLAAPGVAPSQRTAPPSAPNALTLTPSATGVAIQHKFPLGPGLPPGTTTADLHLSTSSGFTPSSTTLYARNCASRFDIGGLTPGTTYYARMAYRDRASNVSAFSPQVSFVAGPTQLSFACKAIASADVNPYVDDSQVLFGTELYDPQNCFASSTFTAPVAGFYRFRVKLEISAATAGDSAMVYLNKNATGKTAVGGWCPAVTTPSDVTIYPWIDEVLQLAAGDTVKVYPLWRGTGATKILRAFSSATPYRPGCQIEVNLVSQ